MGRSSQSSLLGLKLPEDSTRKSRSRTSKRREQEELPESKRLSSVCPLMKSEEELKMLLPEIRLLRLPRKKSEKETSKRCKLRKLLPEVRRTKPPLLTPQLPSKLPLQNQRVVKERDERS